MSHGVLVCQNRHLVREVEINLGNLCRLSRPMDQIEDDFKTGGVVLRQFDLPLAPFTGFFLGEWPI